MKKPLFDEIGFTLQESEEWYRKFVATVQPLYDEALAAGYHPREITALFFSALDFTSNRTMAKLHVRRWRETGKP